MSKVHPGQITAIWKCDKKTKKRIERYESIEEASHWIKDNTDTEASFQSIKGAINGVVSGQRKQTYNYVWEIDLDDLPNEIWREIYHRYIDGIKGVYVSSEGRVKRGKSISRGYIDGDDDDCGGYYRINLINDYVKKSYRVQRLVAFAFLPNFYGLPQVNHKNGNKLDNRVINLEWISASKNMAHAHKTGLNKGRGKGIEQLTLKGEFIKLHKNGAEAGRNIKGDASHILKCCKSGNTAYGFKWKFL